MPGPPRSGRPHVRAGRSAGESAGGRARRRPLPGQGRLPLRLPPAWAGDDSRGRATAGPRRGADLRRDRSARPVLRLRRLVLGPLSADFDRDGHRQGQLHHGHRRRRRGLDRRRLPDEHRRPACDG